MKPAVNELVLVPGGATLLVIVVPTATSVRRMAVTGKAC